MNLVKTIFMVVVLSASSVFAQSDYNPKTKEFATLCDLDLPVDNSWGFNQVYVHYQGNSSGKTNGPALVKLVRRKDENKSHDVYSYQCLSARFSDVKFFTSLDTKLPGSLTLRVDMKVVTGNSLAHDLFHGVNAPPNEIEISWKNSLHGSKLFSASGKCNPINIPVSDEFVGCFTGFNLEGNPAQCKSIKTNVNTVHFSKLCKLPHVNGEAKQCESGEVLCSKNVSTLMLNRPWSGYRIDGTKVSCQPSSSPSACHPVGGDPVDGACEAVGGVQLPDCKYPGSECRSICSKKIN